MAAPTESTDAALTQAEFDVQADSVDRLGALEMSTTLRDMLLGQDYPNALPLALRRPPGTHRWFPGLGYRDRTGSSRLDARSSEEGLRAS